MKFSFTAGRILLLVSVGWSCGESVIGENSIGNNQSKITTRFGDILTNQNYRYGRGGSRHGQCHLSKADIFFLVDSSGSVGSQNFQLQKDFIVDFINKMTISLNDVMVGVFTFSTSPTREIKLLQNRNKASLIAGVKAIPYRSGSTHTGTAIEKVIQQALTGTSDNRAGVPDTLIVMTDGQSNNKAETFNAARHLHATGTATYAIGIGSGVNRDEIVAIASDASKVKVISSFNDLRGITNTLFRDACQSNNQRIVTTTTPTTTTTTPTTTPTTPKTTTTIPTTTTTTPTTTTTTPTTTTTTPTTTTTTPTTTTTTPTTTTTTPTTTTTTPTTTTSTRLPTTTPTVCSLSKADIFFLVDSSGSVGSSNFQLQKDFIVNFINKMTISVTDVLVGVVTFSTLPTYVIPLMKNRDKASLLANVGAIRYIRGSTNTGIAIEYVIQHALSGTSGNRLDVPDTLIVMTDGQSNNKSLTLTAARHLHATGTDIYAIGIGDGVNKDEIGAIASDPTKVKVVSSFQGLGTISDTLFRETCQSNNQRTVKTPTSTTTTTTTTTPTPSTTTTTPSTTTPTNPSTTTPTTSPTGCTAPMVDIVFILDSSGSVGETDFRKLLNFVSDFAQYAIVGPNNIQMSVLTFASDVTANFELNTYDRSDSIINAVLNIPYEDGGTHTEKALQMALYHSFTRQTGDRPNAKNVLVIVTDGYSYDHQATQYAADMLHLYQIETIAVGVGEGVDDSELQGIATDSRHILKTPSFDSLNSLRSKIQLFLC
ncbi:LOW QUALITY PROTEIN: cartilage matrix protein-like [Argopecten irradians]|uniref:LOW QUALITY PROTEIN: cartilage matrix protein-like n=1 Tax=Argopecten irradians TaxID=31199 RepID=UPI0037149209